MKHYVLYDPKPFWKGEAGHLAYSLHRARIIYRFDDCWLQDEVPGFVICDPNGVAEIYFGDLIEFGRGAKPNFFASIEEYNGVFPTIENWRQVIDKIDAQFLALCSREGLL